MLRIVVRVIINAIALWVAARLVGAQAPGDVWQLLLVSIIFGLLNAFVRPILTLLTCPFYILTLGLFTFVMNVIILWLTERISGGLVDWGGFGQMLVAGIIVSLVSFFLNLFLGDDKK
jgi:putative membrane protein